MSGAAVGAAAEVRFLRAVAERIGRERISELYLFAPMRQAGVETGIAVVAAEGELPAVEKCDPTDAAAGELPAESAVVADAPAAADPSPPRRYTVYSARYRHTLKGPDRGKWEVDIVPEADAPLQTVVAVVRGVQRRAGDPAEAFHMSAKTLEAALVDPTWSSRRD